MSQEEYIAILFQDLGFDSVQRKAFLKEHYGVNFPDELSSRDRSEPIDDLKMRKEGRY